MPQTKELVSAITNNPVSAHLMTFLERMQKERPNYLRVLTYHEVEEVDGFNKQMAYLAQNFHVISLERVVEAVLGGDPLPPRSVLITFDDACRNFAECAWPFLKDFNLPVTVFVPTSFPSQPDNVFWWDRLQHAFHNTTRRDLIETPIGEISLATEPQRRQAASRLKKSFRFLPYSEVMAWTYQLCGELGTSQPKSRVLSWDDLRRLADEGVALAPHSQTHPYLDELTAKEVKAEATGSLRDLEREIGKTLPVFAYPNGRFRNETVQALQQAGFVMAFTTIRGVNDLDTADPFQLRRVNIGSHATLPVLRARLLHASRFLNRLRPLPRNSVQLSED
jgi:peptidoglycan/xylan/chitin deacetylase (PgdA/CDA1 family)